MENPWVIRTSYCSEEEGFPHLLRSCTLRLGIRKKPEYVWKEYRENGMEKCSMAVYLGESRNYPNHPPFQITFIGHRFPTHARASLEKLSNNCAKTIAERSLRLPSDISHPATKTPQPGRKESMLYQEEIP
jgi:hypothetical protein